MKRSWPPFRYFLYVLGTVNAVMAAIYLVSALIIGGPGLEIIIPVMLVVSVVSAWSVFREFSGPAKT
jgi:hypothetical protein